MSIIYRKLKGIAKFLIMVISMAFITVPMVYIFQWFFGIILGLVGIAFVWTAFLLFTYNIWSKWIHADGK